MTLTRYQMAALAFLLTAPAAHAIDITDDTPARGITILMNGFPPIIGPQIVTMAECRQGLKDNVEDIKANENGTLSFTLICVPADMSQEGSFVSRDLPIEQYIAK